MKNRLAVVLACVASLGLGGTAVAQQADQIPSEGTIAVTENTTVKLTGESDLYKETEQFSPLDRKVSIRVSNVPISAFLNSITTQAKINFIMSEEFANKKVTASLTRVTVREALDTLLRVHGLAYQRIGKSDSYVVTKRSNDAPDTITKIYTLSYISLQGIGSAQSELNSIMPQDVSYSSSSSSTGLDTTSGMSMGTGTAFVRAGKEGICHIGGSGVGGGTVLGLCEKLCGATSFKTVVEMAEGGQLDRVDLNICDISTGVISTLTPDTTASNFGKMEDGVSPQDLTVGVLNMVFQTIGMMAVFACRNDSVKDVVLTGTLTQVPFAKRVFEALHKMHGVNFIIPPNAIYATATGAALSYLYKHGKIHVD